MKSNPHIHVDPPRACTCRCDCRVRFTRLAYTVEEAAELVGISRASAYNLLAADALVARKLAGSTRILHHELLDCLERLPRVPPAGTRVSPDNEALPTSKEGA